MYGGWDTCYACVVCDIPSADIEWVSAEWSSGACLFEEKLFL